MLEPDHFSLLGKTFKTKPLILAPMDGYTDLPFRKIAKMNGADILYSEFINAIDVINKHPFIPQLTDFDECERPFAYQIFDESPERILFTAKLLAKRKPDFIDINLGCSAKTVANRGAGAGLLRTPEKIKRIFELLKREINLPITAKMRIGWDENLMNYLEIANILQDCGASMIAVHGRTKKQGYNGQSDWEKIAEIKSSVKIPVIANGDIKTVEDLRVIDDLTACDGYMIGRAALKNPWIFSKKDLYDVDFNTRWQTLKAHLMMMINFYGKRTGLILFRKHLKNYLDIASLNREERTLLFNLDSPTRLLNVVRPLLEEKYLKDLHFMTPV